MSNRTNESIKAFLRDMADVGKRIMDHPARSIMTLLGVAAVWAGMTSCEKNNAVSATATPGLNVVPSHNGCVFKLPDEKCVWAVEYPDNRSWKVDWQGAPQVVEVNGVEVQKSQEILGIFPGMVTMLGEECRLLETWEGDPDINNPTGINVGVKQIWKYYGCPQGE